MIFFPPLSLFLPLCLYFSPCVFIFSLLGHAINCSTFAGGVLGENILRKTCRKINGGKKNGIFSHFHIFPHGPCCLWFPFSDSYVTEVHENDIYPWLKCTFFCLYFVMNNPDNCSFNHFFFSSILLPSALLSLSTFRGGLDFFGPKMALAIARAI